MNTTTTEALTQDGVDRGLGGFYLASPDMDADKRRADWDANLTVVNQMIGAGAAAVA